MKSQDLTFEQQQQLERKIRDQVIFYAKMVQRMNALKWSTDDTLYSRSVAIYRDLRGLHDAVKRVNLNKDTRVQIAFGGHYEGLE